MKPPGYTSRLLAEYALGYRSNALGGAQAQKALDCILDNITSAMAGTLAPTTVAARTVAAETFAHGSVPVWFSGQALGAIGAAWCNSLAASCLDFDDGHRVARGHPGSAIVPAVLSLAFENGADTQEVLAAVAIGYEIAIRAARSQNQERIQTHQSGRWAGYGVAAACGRLAGLDGLQLSHALAIAGVSAPNQLANGSSGYANDTGNSVKEGIATSVWQAMTAVRLARLGHTGPADLFDHPSHYDADRLISGLGDPTMILGTYFKLASCCRYIHPALEGLDEILATAPLHFEEIERMEVQTFGWVLKLSNKPAPENLFDVQYSLPFCLAARAIRGAGALAPIAAELLSDGRIPALAERVSIKVCPVFDRRFPQETLAKVSVFTRSGKRQTSSARAPRAELARTDLIEKFRAAAQGRLAQERQSRVLGVFEASAAGDIRSLADALGESLSAQP